MEKLISMGEGEAHELCFYVGNSCMYKSLPLC